MRLSFANFAGFDSGGGTPDPIPNSEVKSASGDGSAAETLWESSTKPALMTRVVAPLGSSFLWSTSKHDGRIDNSMIYHLTTPEDWQKAKTQGFYDFCSLKKEGFIHCSTKDQFLRVANTKFKNQQQLLLLGIEESAIEADIKYENLEGGSENFPHIYGAIPLQAVTDTWELKKDPKSGQFQTPFTEWI